MNTPLRPPAARYLLWNSLLVRMVNPSRNCAGIWALPRPASRSVGLPLPLYTQMRVLLPTSRPIWFIGSFRCQAPPPYGPHMSMALNPPASAIETPTRMGQKPADRLRKPDNDPA